MKRFVFTLWLCLMTAAGGAQAAGGTQAAGYENALLLVRQSKYSEALSEFKTLAATGHAASQFSIGLIYHLGRGVQQDLETAYMWYKKAAVQKYSPAMNNIGMMYLNGEYVAQNRNIAFKLFLKASPDHSQAKDNLGQCYENAWGTDRNIPDAIKYYQQSGDTGYILGWFHLAQLYEKDYPKSPKNIDEAVKWYTKAALRKLDKARTRLAELGRLPPELAP